ncbi:MAG: hypothetical protein WDW38_001082 [Sanguina aurantia]
MDQQRVLAQPDMLILGHGSSIMYRMAGSGWEQDRYWQQVVRRGWSKGAVAQALLLTLQQLQPTRQGTAPGGAPPDGSGGDGTSSGSSSSSSSALQRSAAPATDSIASNHRALLSLVSGRLLQPGVRYSEDKHQSPECLSLQLERTLASGLMRKLRSCLAQSRTPLLTRMVVSSMPARRSASQRGSGALQAATWCQVDLLPATATTAHALRHVMQRFQISRQSCVVAHQLSDQVVLAPALGSGVQAAGLAPPRPGEARQADPPSSVALDADRDHRAGVSELAAVAGNVIVLPAPAHSASRSRSVVGSSPVQNAGREEQARAWAEELDGACIVRPGLAVAAGVLEGLKQLRVM